MAHLKGFSLYSTGGTGVILSKEPVFGQKFSPAFFRIQISHFTACTNMSSQNKQINKSKQIRNKLKIKT
jgi:hypothetical protein